MWASTSRASISPSRQDANDVQDTYYFHEIWIVCEVSGEEEQVASWQLSEQYTFHSKGRAETLKQFSKLSNEMRASTTIGNQKEIVSPVNNGLISLMDLFTKN